jgi:hypothetical protein
MLFRKYKIEDFDVCKDGVPRQLTLTDVEHQRDRMGL